MGRHAEVNLHPNSPETEAAAPDEGDRALVLAENPLTRLGAEADLLERLLSHIAEQRDKARAARERLERCRATMEEVDRDSDQVLIAAQAAAIESRLTRLRAAASLAKEFAQLRASEADRLKRAARRPDATGSANDAAPPRDVLRTDAGDPAPERRLRRVS